MSLGEVISSFKTPSQVSHEEKAKVAELETARATQEKDFDQRMGHVQALTDTLMRQIESERVDWERLKEEDPVQYTLKREEARDRREAVQQSLSQMQHEGQRREQEAEVAFDKRRSEQKTKLQSIMTGKDGKPDMRTEATFNKVTKALNSYLEESYGLSQDEVNSVVDHREVEIIWKAAQYDALMAKRTKTTKKVRALPKLIPKGARREEGEKGNSRQKDALFQQLQESGDSDVAAELFKDLI